MNSIAIYKSQIRACFAIFIYHVPSRTLKTIQPPFVTKTSSSMRTPSRMASSTFIFAHKPAISNYSLKITGILRLPMPPSRCYDKIIVCAPYHQSLKVVHRNDHTNRQRRPLEPALARLHFSISFGDLISEFPRP